MYDLEYLDEKNYKNVFSKVKKLKEDKAKPRQVASTDLQQFIKRVPVLIDLFKPVGSSAADSDEGIEIDRVISTRVHCTVLHLLAELMEKFILPFCFSDFCFLGVVIEV